jgi:hypothetical protein
VCDLTGLPPNQACEPPCEWSTARRRSCRPRLGTHCGYGDGRDWLRRGSWPAPRARNAEACSSRRPRRRELELVRDARPDALCSRGGDPARRPGDRSNLVERVIDVVVAPRTPGIRFAAAGTRLGGCSASADRGPRCAYSSARGSERRYADDRCSRRMLPGLNLRIWRLPATLFTAPPRQVPETPQVDSISRHE